MKQSGEGDDDVDDGDDGREGEENTLVIMWAEYETCFESVSSGCCLLFTLLFMEKRGHRHRLGQGY